MRNVFRATLALLAAAVVGCGPSEAPRYPVHGVVTFNGQPYANALIQFVPDPSNASPAEAEDVTGPEGNYKLTNSGRPGLPVGKYKVFVKYQPPAEEVAAEKAKYEDEEQRRDALRSLGIDPDKQAAKKAGGKPPGEFNAQVEEGDNELEFDVKGKGAK